jgi:iron complex outermembrane recepter protein
MPLRRPRITACAVSAGTKGIAVLNPGVLVQSNPQSRTRRLRVISAVVAVLLPVTAWGQSPSLADLTIEDLMQIRVTSVSRRDQRAADVAAAVYIITQDDIRRSGLTSLPALLRLVPGAQVAQVISNKWAVSLRGFNSLFSN